MSRLKRLPLWLVLLALPVQATELQVSAAEAVPLQFASLTEFQALSGIDSTRVVLLVVNRQDSMQVLSRSGSDFGLTMTGGAYVARGGPFGGSLYALTLDGVTDRAQLGTGVRDSVNIGGGVMVWQLSYFAAQPGANVQAWTQYLTAGPQLRYQPSNTRWEFNVINSEAAEGAARVTMTAANARGWHWTRCERTMDGNVILAVDAITPVSVAAPGGTVTGTTDMSIGTPSTTGGVALFAWLDFSDRVPTTAERTDFYTLVSPHWTNADTFASIQTALDYARRNLDGNAVIDTVTIAAGTYPEPVLFAVDSLFVRGAGVTTVLDGTGFPAGTIGARISAQPRISLNSMTIQDYATGVRVSGTSGRTNLNSILLYNNTTGIIDTTGANGDTLFADHLTIDNSGTAIRAATPVGTDRYVYVTSSILSNNGIGFSDAGKIEFAGIVYYLNTTNNNDAVGTGAKTANPYYKSYPTDFRILFGGPAYVGGDAYGAAGFYYGGGFPFLLFFGDDE